MADFHFIRPWWLLSLIAVFIVSYLLKRLQVSNSGWQQVIPKHLASKLINGEQTERSNSLFIPCLITVLAIVALAGPAWQKLPQPVYNVQKGAVIVMDMSNSMYSTDLTPNRLTRARYKAIDLLDKLNEGDTGLIVYAGDSFIISPLTEDINNIKLLLPALSPQLMPVQGSNPLLALSMANDMLKNAGHLEGDIYWFTDDVDQYDIDEINALATKFNHRINILGIGTKNAAPIKMPNGQLLKDDTGSIVIPHLTSGALQGIANNARGTYQSISNSASDIDSLVSNAIKKAELKEKETQFADGDQFKEAGPYLILLILPLLLGYFRRGNLLAVLPCLLFFNEVPRSYAAQASVEKNVVSNIPTNTDKVETAKEENSSSFWNDLWQTKDQQGQKKYNNEQFEEAAQQFENSMWQGSAHYKNGNYEQALESFKKSDSAEALYNQGNSLAKLQKFDEAIDAYKAALKKNPDHENAKANQSLIEQIKQQQEQQKKDQQGDGDSSDEKQDGEENQENSDGEQSEQDQQQRSGNDSQDQSDQESSEQNQEQQSQEEKEQQEKPPENSSDNSDDDAKESAEDNAAKPSEEETQDEENLAEQQAQNEASEQEKGEAGDIQQLTEAEQAAQEEEQKHQQLLKKVTDDPYLLLRNKMQLEYQKRRNQDSGVNKKW